jgi:hypothetical protein
VTEATVNAWRWVCKASSEVPVTSAPTGKVKLHQLSVNGSRLSQAGFDGGSVAWIRPRRKRA